MGGVDPKSVRLSALIGQRQEPGNACTREMHAFGAHSCKTSQSHQTSWLRPFVLRSTSGWATLSLTLAIIFGARVLSSAACASVLYFFWQMCIARIHIFLIGACAHFSSWLPRSGCVAQRRFPQRAWTKKLQIWSRSLRLDV